MYGHHHLFIINTKIPRSIVNIKNRNILSVTKASSDKIHIIIKTINLKNLNKLTQ